MEQKVQYQALVKLDCYITAEWQTEPEEDGQSMWSAESPKAPRLTKVLLSGQFSARRKKQGEKGFSLWDRRQVVWQQCSPEEVG